jgi:MraZ protein
VGESGINARKVKFFMSIPKRVSYAGSYLHQMDVKNRLTLPAKWRLEGDAEEYMAMPDESGCIRVLPPRMLELLNERVSERFSLADEDGQAMLTELFSVAHIFTYDKQGRFGLPDELIQHAGLGKETLFVGGLSTFSIWSPERFANRPRPSKPRSEIIRQIGL